MKILIVIFLEIAAYFIAQVVLKKTKLKHFHWLLTLGLILMIPLTFGLVALHDARQPDNQCSFTHSTQLTPPTTLKTAADYLQQGDYDVDKGDCGQAVLDYTKAIELQPNYAEAYNNRAYTYMRMRAYALAIPDLNKALEIRPNYIHALLNRGDIYNFYYNINKTQAVADYDKAISLGATQKSTSVCGHRILAKEGWKISVFLLVFRDPNKPGCD